MHNDLARMIASGRLMPQPEIDDDPQESLDDYEGGRHKERTKKATLHHKRRKLAKKTKKINRKKR